MKQELRDRTGYLVGTITENTNGRQEARDRTGFLKGTYYRESDLTKDRSGNLVGKGNLLAALLSRV